MKRSIQKKLANQALNDGLPVLASIHIGANKTEKKLRAKLIEASSKYGHKPYLDAVQEMGIDTEKGYRKSEAQLIISIYDKIKR